MHAEDGQCNDAASGNEADNEQVLKGDQLLEKQ